MRLSRSTAAFVLSRPDNGLHQPPKLPLSALPAGLPIRRPKEARRWLGLREVQQGWCVMAALPYVQLYVADYLADTAHLTAAQHGAYLLLIFNYWQRGKPLNNSNERLTNVARMTSEEWADAKPILSEFFEIDGDEWVHARIERDLEAVNSKSGRASEAGKASAASRAAKKVADVQRTLNHTDTDTDTDTEKTKKTVSSKPPRFDFLQSLRDSGVPDQAAKDYIATRKAKRCAQTETAFNQFISEVKKSGLLIADVVAICCKKSWGGFEADWLLRDSAAHRGSGAIPLEARNKAIADNWVPPEMRAQA
jgi:uncharacterized protein YdaU (DUF1376 family)